MGTRIYLRKSRTEELNEPVEATLKRHREQLLEFARKNDLDIEEIYEEVVSGETLYARPEMLRLLNDIENQGCDAVLCMDIDRLGRGSMSDQGIILETLKRNNCKIITPRKIYDLNNDLDETYSEFETFMARQELKQIKRRLNRGLQKTIQDGGYIANAPYGYRKVTKNKMPSLEIVDEEAYFVRMIFDMYVNQGIGTHTIAETISDLGAKPHRSDRFARTSIRKILKNPTYIGKIVWNQKKQIRKGSHGNVKTIVVYNKPDQWTYSDGIHPPIIDEITFSRAQEILSGRYHPPYYKGTVENSLAGLVKCGHCGGSMQRRICGQRIRRPYLICPRKGCIPSTQHAFVEEAVLSFLRQHLAEIAVELESQQPQDTSVLEKTLRVIRKEISTVERQKGSLHDLLEQGVYTVDVFVERSKLLQEKESLLKRQEDAQIDAIERANGQKREVAFRKIKSVLEAYSAADAQSRNMMLKSVIQEIAYDKEPGSSLRDFSLTIQLKDF